jgi:serine/threonine protein kinase
MRPELWPEVESALGAALERSEAERLAWVAQSCHDPEVRAEVEALLGVYNKAEGFLDPKGRLIGAHLGHYEILELIGAGGMGEVYRARDPRIGRDVAVKVLPAVFSSDRDRLRRFTLEVRGSQEH